MPNMPLMHAVRACFLIAATAFFFWALKFLPIVKRETAKVSLADKYNAVAGKASSVGLLKKQDADLDSYVTGKALDGLFLMIGEEEKKLRKDPLGAGSQLLKKVFGGG